MGSSRRRVGLALIGVALVAGAALALDAARAADHVRQAEESAWRLHGDVADADARSARAELGVLQHHTGAARRLVSSRLWRGAQLLPILGRTPSTVGDGVRTLDDAARQVLPPLVDSVHALTSPGVRPAGDRVDLTALRAVVPDLRGADARLQRLARHEPRSLVLPAVAHRRARLADDLDRLARLVHTATTVLDVLPAALGGAGERRYFLAFQNPSESRGTGGVVGAYAILVARDGVLQLPVVRDDRDLERLPPSRFDLGEEHRRLYGDGPRLWANTNLSPDFPSAARAWLDSWEQQTGTALDGVLATDPVGLSHLLRAVGDVELDDGSVVTRTGVVRLAGWDAYARFDGDNDGRKQFLVEVARTVVRRALTGGASLAELVDALSAAAADGRLRAYSRHPSEQSLLEGTPLAGELPRSRRPLAALVVNNLAGNKLDFHLQRSVRVEWRWCGGSRRTSTVSVVLTNAVPPGPLPAYASGRLDLPAGAAFEAGSTRLQVALYATTGAALRQLAVDGRRAAVAVGSERGHPVFAVPLDLGRGQRRTLRFDLVEPPSHDPPDVPVQPLVGEQRTDVARASCG